MPSFVGIVFDGLAYGGLLFLISVGLSVTLGVMNFVNLAHGAFAMFGGYVTVHLMNQWGWPYLATLPMAFLSMALSGAVLEKLAYRRLYKADPLQQVLFTIGLTFMAVATATFVWGPVQQPFRLPDFLQGQVHWIGIDFGAYRLALLVCVVLIAGALYALLERTRFGAQLRAAVDQPNAANGLGIDVRRIFQITFALGTGLAGLGGALGIGVLGLEPGFAFKYLAYFLLIVAVGGGGSIPRTAAAALALGLFDVLGKYYVPEVGAFLIYALMVVALLALPKSLQGHES